MHGALHSQTGGLAIAGSVNMGHVSQEEVALSYNSA